MRVFESTSKFAKEEPMVLVQVLLVKVVAKEREPSVLAMTKRLLMASIVS